jgi:hypothetical protein
MTDLFAEVERRPRSLHTRAAPWTKRVVLTLLAVFIAFVLGGAIGQQPSTSTAASASARMTLSAPDTVRGGLLVQARITIHALRAIKDPRLILGRGWFEGMQVSSIEPGAGSESSRNGDVTEFYPALAAGETRTIWIEVQVDPTNVGHRAAGVRLLDGTKTLVRIAHRLTILP